MIRYANLIDALDAAPGERPFITAWIDEVETERVTFAEFRALRLGCRDFAIVQTKCMPACPHFVLERWQD